MRQTATVWTYIVRRLLLMIPTLFGVTVVSFCIMQLAPGDPLLNQLGSQGAAGESSQTRESYLIQKRDLKLDKPLILNFRNFVDYREKMLHAAFVRARSEEEIKKELTRLAESADDSEAKSRLKFFRSFDIEEFDERLQQPEKRSRLAAAVYGYTQVFCEDVGKYGVPVVMEMLASPEVSRRDKIGLIDCLQYMVVEAHQYTYSRNPSKDESPLVRRVWGTWWDRQKSKFPPISEDRLEVLKKQLATMAGEPSRQKLFELLEEEYFYEREDLGFFAEILLGDSSLAEKIIASVVLKLYVAKPLEMSIRRDADDAEVQVIIDNWLAHYEPRQDQYELGTVGKLWAIAADTQYAHMLWRLVTFNFGRSALKTREPVREKIVEAVIVSAPLMVLSQLVIYFVAIPLGILCSVNRGKWLDQIISVLLFLLYSVPPFVAGMMFLLFFCYGDYVRWFPMERLHSDGADQMSFVRYALDYLWHCILPVTCLSLFSLAGLAMYSRSSMLDVIGQDYIRTARAKGLPRHKVIMKHALRNSLIPVITLFSNFLPAMLGGSVLIEFLFNIPGMGRLSWASIEQKDFPTLMALIYVQAIVVLLSILMTDILYVFVDPRISFEGRESS